MLGKVVGVVGVIMTAAWVWTDGFIEGYREGISDGYDLKSLEEKVAAREREAGIRKMIDNLRGEKKVG